MTDLLNSNEPDDSIGQIRSVRVTTGARLHFGLLNTVSPFGGVGMMIDRPGTELIATEAREFDCDPVLMQRLRPIAQRIAKLLGLDQLPPCRIELKQQPEPHCGLGSGTQLALAAAEAICRCIGQTVDRSVLATELAIRAQRSVVGTLGYFHGGLIFETGVSDDALNPIPGQISVPPQWCVAVLRPTHDIPRVSGKYEQEQFSNLMPATASITVTINELATSIVQAAEQSDFESFTDSIQRYNHQSGMLFESVQGGPYNGAEVSELVGQLSDHGARGVGQSSWGPGVFAWFESNEDAKVFVEKFPVQVERIALAHARNGPRQLVASNCPLRPDEPDKSENGLA